MSDTCVPVLKYVQKNGNTTTYEWRTGTKPDKIDETAVVIDVSDEKDVTDNLDAVSGFRIFFLIFWLLRSSLYK